MGEEMLAVYNTLTDEEKKEAYDFVVYLAGKSTTQKTGKKLSAFGLLHHYANPALWNKEKDTWADAMIEKYGADQ